MNGNLPSINRDFVLVDPAPILASLFRLSVEIVRNGQVVATNKAGTRNNLERDGYRSLRQNFELTHRIGDDNFVFTGIEQLDVFDQSVLFAIIFLSSDGKAEPGVHRGAVGHELELWTQINPTREATGDRLARIETRMMSIMDACHLSRGARNYLRVRESLWRLRHVSYGVNYRWAMNLLSYVEQQDGSLLITLNRRFADALVGSRYVRIALDERYRLSTNIAQLSHAWLSAWAWPGCKNQVISIEKLMGNLFADVATGAAARKRKQRVIEALKEIGDMPQWKIVIDRDRAIVSRPPPPSGLKP